MAQACVNAAYETVQLTQLFLDELARNRRKACLNSAEVQGLKGQERKAFVDACMASTGR